jgi:hypothetical protein
MQQTVSSIVVLKELTGHYRTVQENTEHDICAKLTVKGMQVNSKWRYWKPTNEFDVPKGRGVGEIDAHILMPLDWAKGKTLLAQK